MLINEDLHESQLEGAAQLAAQLVGKALLASAGGAAELTAAALHPV